MGEFMILKKKYAFLTAFIFSFLSAAVAMENNEDIFNGTYVIKNVHTNKFIGYREKLEQTGNPSFVEDFYWEDEYHEGDETVIIHPGIFKESICSIEKSSEGYSIKNYQFEGYLFIKTESRVAVWTKGLKTPSANCYFDILKGEDENKDKYFFKSKKFHDYLSFDIFSSNNENRLQKRERGKKLFLSENKDNGIYFTFHPFDPSIFNIHSLTKTKVNLWNNATMTNNNNIDQNIVTNNNKNIIKKKMGPTNVIRTKKKNIDIDQNIVPNHNDKEEDDGNNKSNDDENNKN